MECDNIAVVRKLSTKGRDLSPLGTLINHFEVQVHGLHMRHISNVNRSQNVVADRLATYSSTFNEPPLCFL